MWRYPFLFFKLTIFLSCIALAASFMSGRDQEGTSTQETNRTEDIRQFPHKETVADFRGVAKKAIPAVVSIKVQTKKRSQVFGNSGQSDDPSDLFGGNDLWELFGLPRRNAQSQLLLGQASGVIVNPNGYILTNSHVVHGMDSILVQLHDGREFTAKVLGDDSNSELALLKIDASHLPFLTLGNSDDLEVGQWVAAIGNPFGLQATLTVGVVSAKSRNNLDIARYEDFIQTDAAINRGNSGGPLVTLNGEVIGINTAIATTSAAGYLGIGFAIPSNMARHFMDEILSDGKFSRGFLGVSLQSIDYNLAKVFGLKKVEGALVTNISKNSAAERSGLQVEDLILRYNERPIENAATLRNAVYMMKPGSKVVLTVLRKDQIIQVPVIVGDFKENATVVNNAPTPTQKQQNPLGIQVENLTPEIAQRFGYAQDEGIVITAIQPESIAELAGLKKGALILAINREKISNVNEFNQSLAQISKDRPILFQIKQDNVYMFISLQIDSSRE